MSLERVVVVGGNVAGLRAVQTLRRQGYDGRLTLVSDEPHAPYNRPPLSKDVLTGETAPAATALVTPDELEQLDLELRLRTTATGLDLGRREVVCDDERVPFDGLVIATGSSARRLPALEGLAGVHVLRTLDDAVALRNAFAVTAKLLIVGCGFIGSEVASTAHSCGIDVTIVDVVDTPLLHAVGPEIGTFLGDLHRDAGVTLRLGRGVESLEGNRRVERARLTDGTVLDVDAVLVCIGIFPNTGWLDGSGLRIDNGVVCDATLNAGADGVYAAGDVARWPNELLGSDARAEHWTSAAEQGMHVALNLLAGDAARPYTDSSYVWSDQYGLRLQVVGATAGADELRVVDGDLADRRFVAWYRRGDRLVGAFGASSARLMVQSRRLIEAGAGWDDALGAL